VRTLKRSSADSNQRSIVIVEDNGPGIAVEEREKVFERFYRISDRGVTGSGLGLAIVREIAKIHSADVRLDDGPSGVGTSIAIDFPFIAAPPTSEAPSPGGQMKMLAHGQN
jgi:two-component system sensor histidine kinase TctE